MLQPLDGPSLQDILSVTTGTVVEAKIGATALAERKAVTLQPRDGDIYVYFGDDTGVAPSAATMIAKGLTQYSGAPSSYEAGQTQRLYLLAVTATTSIVIVERA